MGIDISSVTTQPHGTCSSVTVNRRASFRGVPRRHSSDRSLFLPLGLQAQKKDRSDWYHVGAAIWGCRREFIEIRPSKPWPWDRRLRRCRCICSIHLLPAHLCVGCVSTSVPPPERCFLAFRGMGEFPDPSPQCEYVPWLSVVAIGLWPVGAVAPGALSIPAIPNRTLDSLFFGCLALWHLCENRLLDDLREWHPRTISTHWGDSHRSTPGGHLDDFGISPT